jgi:hypothetical protein
LGYALSAYPNINYRACKRNASLLFEAQDKHCLRAYPKILSEAPEKSSVEAFARIFPAPFRNFGICTKPLQDFAAVVKKNLGYATRRISQNGFAAKRIFKFGDLFLETAPGGQIRQAIGETKGGF